MKILRCMAYQQNGVYVAVCLDLSLAAQADTVTDAKIKLEEQIKDFIAEALSEPRYAKDLLMNRKAPLSLWLKYWSIRILMRLSKKSSKASLFDERWNVAC